jgi:outer membrane receptor protein involved in Fe transport
MTHESTKYGLLTAALCLSSPSVLLADPAAPATAATPATLATGSDNLEEIVVKGVNLEDQVSPLQRKVTSVFGLQLSVLDTPRAVTEINAAQMRDQSIIDVTDFSKIVSSAYTNDQFGGANVPFLRGQQAEVFQNGMLRTPRSDGQPLSFNSVEGFDVVKGPASVVYGPTGNVGGYVNLVTKRPSFDGQHETVTLTYGEYNTRKAQFDVTGPVSDTLAYRVSFEYIHSDSYYRFGYDHSTDVYAALRWIPSDKLTVDFNTEFYLAHYTENTGINRPTQQLIDNGTYYQGTGVSPYAFPGDPRNFLSVVNVTSTAQINRSYQLVAPGDHDQGSNFQAQLDVNYNINDSISLVNKGYFEDYSQQQLEYAQRYFNDIKESYNFEDRLELHASFGKNQAIAGIAYRFIHVLAYGDFYNEYLNATDITTNPANFPIVQPNLYGVVQVPGNATYYAVPGATYAGSSAFGYPYSIANTQDQTSNQIGAFIQDLYQVTDQVSILGGLRVDLIHEKLSDPLPPPGFTAAHATATQGESAADLSVTYKPLTWLTTYLTADYNQSPVSTNGGGFAAFTGNTIDPTNFRIKNFLYEGGVKAALLDNTLFLSSAGFFQKRAQTDQFQDTQQIDAYGAEFEANFQPSRNFSATAAYSYLDARLHGASPTSFTENVYDSFAAPYGTGVGSPNFNPLPAGDYRLPAVPSNLFSAFVKYRTDLGIGASSGVVVTGPINTSYIGNVRIPTQYTWDGSIFYEARTWSVRANFYNITNQKNWIAEAGAQGNDLITAAMPFHYQISASFRF